MLTSTFCHLPGVGEKTEQRLWAAGITCWDHLVEQGAQACSRYWRSAWDAHVQESRLHYARRDPNYFAAPRLPANQLWRLYHDFHDCCAFLDIETTGLSAFSEITTIVLYDGRSLRSYVNGHNLQDFLTDLQAYRLLVTYNGQSFDIPFLERQFRTQLTQAHIDLRYVLRSLGLTGGLKGCERRLGLCRPGLEEVDGFMAVLLWQEYRRNKNERALETLSAYNAHDVLSLQPLMIHAHNEKVRQTPFGDSRALPPCSSVSVPFRIDRSTIERLTGVWRPAFQFRV